jgi:hypothetical protein
VRAERIIVSYTSAVVFEELNLLVALEGNKLPVEQHEGGLLGQCLNGDSPTHVVFGGFVQTRDIDSSKSPSSLAAKNLC